MSVRIDVETRDLKGWRAAKTELVDGFERIYFEALHVRSDGNLSEMARRAGIGRARVRAALKRLGIGRYAELGEGGRSA